VKREDVKHEDHGGREAAVILLLYVACWQSLASVILRELRRPKDLVQCFEGSR
jgi:hypothetical protein